MLRWVFSIFLGSLVSVASAFPAHVSTGSLDIATAGSAPWNSFSWKWNNRDVQQFSVKFTNSVSDGTFADITNIQFRLSYPEAGPYYLTLVNGTLVLTATSAVYTLPISLPTTNIPPPRRYYAEFLAYDANQATRTLAKGTVETAWSLFYNTNVATWVPITITFAYTTNDPAISALQVATNAINTRVGLLESDVSVHTGLTTAAHGGIVADDDLRLTNARSWLELNYNLITNPPALGTMAAQSTGDYYTASVADALLNDKATTAEVAQVASDLSAHELLEGTNVHGLGTMSIEDTSGYYTQAASDLLLDTKAGTGTVAAIDSRLSVVETGKLDVVTAASTYATTGTVGAIDDRVSIMETGKLDVVTAASMYATTGTVAAIDGRVSILETNTATKAQGDLADSAVQPTDADYTNTAALAAAAYPSSNPSNYVDASITNGVNTRVDGLTNGAALGEMAVQPTDSDYTNAVALSGSALQPGAAGTSTNLSEYNNDLPGLSTNLSDFNNDVPFLTNEPALIAFSNANQAKITASLTNETLWEAASDQVQMDLTNLEGATNALNTRVGDLETSTGALHTAVGNLEVATNALNTRMGSVETSTGALNTAVGNLQTATNALHLDKVDRTDTNGWTVTAHEAWLTNETYVGTITGATITASDEDSVTVTGPNAAFKWNTNAAGVGGGGSGSGFPLTNDVDLAGFTMSNGSFVGNGAGMTNVPGVVTNRIAFHGESNVSMRVDGTNVYFGASDITLLNSATNAINTRVGSLETATGVLNTAVGNLNTSTNALNTRAGNLEAATNALNTGKLDVDGDASQLTNLPSAGITNIFSTTANGLVPSPAATNSGLLFADANWMPVTNVQAAASNLFDLKYLPLTTTSEYTIAGARPFWVSDADGRLWPTAHKMEVGSRTINVTTNDSLQDAINSIGKYIPYTVDIVVQLNTGTYSLVSGLSISGFDGKGSLTLRSADTDTSAYRTQSAVIDASAGMHGINISYCSAKITISNIRILMKGDTQRYAVYPNSSENVFVQYNSVSDVTTNKKSLGIYGGMSYVSSRGNSFDNIDAALYPAQGSYYISRDDQGTNLNYYGSASWGAFLGFYNTNSLAGTGRGIVGGLLVNPAGAVLP